MSRALLFVICLLMPGTMSFDPIPRSQLIVWNVGQGQWVTWVTATVCYHFDIGGERSAISRVLRLCRGHQHKVLISHLDQDHIRFLQPFLRKVPNACVEGLDLWTQVKKRPVPVHQKCRLDEELSLIYKGAPFTHHGLNPTSKVYLLTKPLVLIPGDSPLSEEKKWALSSALLPTHGLVLGHHGSRTSTGDLLLQHLPQLKWAVASARKAKYGHPHEEVQWRLKMKKIPLLLTEDWGNLQFQFL